MATNLQVGDVAIIGFNSNPDSFSFVSLVWIEAGTQITFADGGWLAAGGFRAGEGTTTWTAAADIPPGTVINSVANAAQFTSTGSFDIAVSGDQVIAFTGSTASPNVLFAVHSNAATWNTDATSAQTSALPTGLVDDQTGISVGAFQNVRYSGVTVGTAAGLRATIQSIGLWTGGNTGITQSTTNMTITADAVTGTAANDILTTSGGISKISDVHAYNGAGGTDTVDYSGSINRLTLNLSDATGLSNTHAAYRDTFTSIERFKLTAFNDTFVGSTADDVVLDAGGSDSYTGGAGTDEVSYEDAASAVTVDLTVATGAANTGWAQGDTYASIEKFRLSAHNDTFIGLNTVGTSNWANGGNGDDSFTSGGAGTTNTFWAGDGNDTVYGSAGTTTMLGGLGDDSFVGGSGRDIGRGEDGADTLNGNAGADDLRGGAGDDTINGGQGDDAVQGDDGVDTLSGGDGLDWLVGGAGIDTMHGDGGNDKVYGGADADLIYGDEGNDDLRGDDGDDILFGGNGNDALRGGNGADTFVFTAGETGRDAIVGFETGVDTLQFSGVLPGEVTGTTDKYGRAVISWGNAGASIVVTGATWEQVQSDFDFV
jgi:Ca2+-binding RTX toxin-like protein